MQQKRWNYQVKGCYQRWRDIGFKHSSLCSRKIDKKGISDFVQYVSPDCFWNGWCRSGTVSDICVSCNISSIPPSKLPIYLLSGLQLYLKQIGECCHLFCTASIKQAKWYKNNCFHLFSIDPGKKNKEVPNDFLQTIFNYCQEKLLQIWIAM